MIYIKEYYNNNGLCTKEIQVQRAISFFVQDANSYKLRAMKHPSKCSYRFIENGFELCNEDEEEYFVKIICRLVEKE